MDVSYSVLLALANLLLCGDLSSAAVPITDLYGQLESISESDIFSAVDKIPGPCREDIIYLIDRYSKEQWALKIYDSLVKSPYGILDGNYIHMGHYEQCVQAEEPTGRFQGRHCMVDININIIYPSDGKFPRSKEQKLPLFIGVCVPSTCSADDVERIISNVAKAKAVDAEIKVDPMNCNTIGLDVPPAGTWVAIVFFLFFVLIGIASTLYDIFQRFKKNNENPHGFWSAFSFYTNASYLLTPKNDTGDSITALFGMRTVTQGWVILGYAYLHTSYGPLINALDVAEYNKDDSKAIIFSSFVAADSFFLFSGMLVYITFFISMAKKGSYDAPLSYIHRYFRLTPPLAMMILLEATVFTYVGKGPMWNRLHASSTENCKSYWWSSLLYVQNYVNPLELCMKQTWYLSADMQMFWLSPVVLYPLALFPAAAWFFLTFLILAVTFIDFAIVYAYELPANFILTPSDDRMAMEYYPFHTRMAPWVIGIALGYLICEIRSMKIKGELTPFWTTVGWILSTVLMTASMQALSYFNHSSDYTALESAFFLAFHRVGWAVGLGWIVYACATDIGGVVDKVLSWKFFQPLSKLSYSAFLLHVTIQRFRIGWLRTNTNLFDIDVVFNFISDFILSNLLAIPFFLLFEEPFRKIDKFLFRGVTLLPWPRRPQHLNQEEETSIESVLENEEREEEETRITSNSSSIENIVENTSAV